MSSDSVRLAALDALPKTPSAHFKLQFYGAVLGVMTGAARRIGSWEDLFARFPFLLHYADELARAGAATVDASGPIARWNEAVVEWEASCGAEHLPLAALRRVAALDAGALTLFIAIGLADEDPRFGAVFDVLQGEMGCNRPTAGLLTGWWDADAAGDARAHLRRLVEVGLVSPVNPSAPRADWSFQIPPAVWDAARGSCPDTPLPGVTYRRADALTPLEALVLDASLTTLLERVVALVRADECGALVVRGPKHNGRGTAVGAVARALGRGLLTIQPPVRPDEERLRIAAPLATLVHAVPLLRVDPLPGETIDIASFNGCDAPVAATIGRHGGVVGAAFARAVTVAIDPPDPALRARHWTSVAADRAIADVAQIAERFRLTAGGIRRSADLAAAAAALAGRASVTTADVRGAMTIMNQQALDTLATRVESVTDWSHVAVAPHTRRELDELERRCRLRERLCDAVGPAMRGQLTGGVKALLFGPSGTGKTMAARALAASLQMDLYRLNVAAILNKYIGETEKNLNAVFTRAEELDVVLLLDEGESWLSSRPATINSATDKYAAFETNFLLERMDSFDGILLITTNGADRIDAAFHRRVDVMVEFAAPDPGERLAIWDVHLPHHHAISYEALADVSTRCAMTGGQIRNAVLHACARALERHEPVTEADLFAAVDREYRKSGAVCPLAGAVADGW